MCENYDRYFRAKLYSRTLKIAYSYCFGLRENLDFPDFLQKQFYNIHYRMDRRWPCLETFNMKKNLDQCDQI